MLTDPPPIADAVIDAAGFAGEDGAGPDTPRLVTSVAEFELLAGTATTALGHMVRGFFANGGTRAYVAGTLAMLESIDDVALLCPLPADTAEAIAQCERRRDRVAILSLPAGLGSVEKMLAARPPEVSAFAAAHHPWVWAGGALTPPGGHVAGIYASSDAVGVTVTDAEMRGLDDPPLERSLPPPEIAALVAGAINPLRDLRAIGRGVRIWATRTLDPDPERRFLPMRRLMIFLETSIARGLRWVVCEPNDEALWTSVRDAIGAFLMNQWRAGKLTGQTPDDAFFVRCDRTTMTQQDVDDGRLICIVGVAALRPAEFVIFRIGQHTATRCA